MKMVINEKTIKSIIRESVKEYLKEIEDVDFEDPTGGDMIDNEDEVWQKHGNKNRFDDNYGMLGVLAQGDDDDDLTKYARSVRSSEDDSVQAFRGDYPDFEPSFESSDNTDYLLGKDTHSLSETINRAVNKAFKKVVNESIKKNK